MQKFVIIYNFMIIKPQLMARLINKTVPFMAKIGYQRCFRPSNLDVKGAPRTGLPITEKK